ncbi:serine hydrolase domain-containing protein [Xanthocytophaga agilis]|uniref:Serine hydrolase domain-containing protein n=1 Tax=Xanthocytophaga agilis TaxID=3048010 RepID=A0AAE3UEC4_9BACT|nr:serine hydrolase domain-containing protein [Xanthocytophaga agilis]MDJ1500087.1 serine hydrolase domain-containing protein [Xanthocytophaga agilis]
MKTLQKLICISLFALLGNCKTAEIVPVSECTLPIETDNTSFPQNAALLNLLKIYTQKGLPGLSVLVKTSNGLWIGASGKAGIEENQDMQPCHIHYLASIAKTYTAVVIMKLVETQKIDLDSPISQYLDTNIYKKIGNGDKATVRQLLNHTSGIRDYVSEINYNTDILNNPMAKYSTDKYLGYIYTKEPYFEPGTDYTYSNTNFLLLALIAEKVTGKPLESLYRDIVFEPLGLQQTYYHTLNQGNLVNSYFDRFGDGKLENISSIMKHLLPTYSGDDGIVATPYDMYLFLDALVTNKLVSESSLMQMTAWVHTRKDPDRPEYGLGLTYMKSDYGDGFGHGGTAGGASAKMYYFPDKQTYLIVCMNQGTFFYSPIQDVYDEFWLELQKIMLANQ